MRNKPPPGDLGKTRAITTGESADRLTPAPTPSSGNLFRVNRVLVNPLATRDFKDQVVSALTWVSSVP